MDRRPLLVAALFAALLAAAPSARCEDEGGRACETVVLLHGQGRTRVSMMLLEDRLEEAGYETVLYGYYVSTSTLDEITRGLMTRIAKKNRCPTYHLVGHSLGNIIARNGFREKFTYPGGLGRIVMLAPPNQSAELARQLRDNKIYHWLTGDSGQKLGDEAFYASLPTPVVEFGVIAGTASFTGLLDGPSDGVVLVENTRLDGMADWVTVERSHTYIMNGEETFHYVDRFLGAGSFGE